MHPLFYSPPKGARPDGPDFIIDTILSLPLVMYENHTTALRAREIPPLLSASPPMGALSYGPDLDITTIDLYRLIVKLPPFYMNLLNISILFNISNIIFQAKTPPVTPIT